MTKYNLTEQDTLFLVEEQPFLFFKQILLGHQVHGHFKIYWQKPYHFMEQQGPFPDCKDTLSRNAQYKDIYKRTIELPQRLAFLKLIVV